MSTTTETPIVTSMDSGTEAGIGPGATATATQPAAATTSRVGTGVVLTLAAIVGLVPFAGDMYLASLPALGAEFDAPVWLTQLTLTGYLLLLGVGQLVAGPVTDAISSPRRGCTVHLRRRRHHPRRDCRRLRGGPLVPADARLHGAGPAVRPAHAGPAHGLARRTPWARPSTGPRPPRRSTTPHQERS